MTGGIRSDVRRLGLYCGVVGPVIWLTVIAVAGAVRPDFSYVTNYISELGERGSTTEMAVRFGGFVFTGALYVCFAGALWGTFRGNWLMRASMLLLALDGVGRIGAGVFPCDPGCVPPAIGPNLHTMFATVGFCSGILSAFGWATLGGRVPEVRALAVWSSVCGAVALVSLVLMSLVGEATMLVGLYEHLATVALSVWLLVFARRVVQTTAV